MILDDLCGAINVICKSSTIERRSRSLQSVDGAMIEQQKYILRTIGKMN
jgi:hypothetical protein